MNELPELSKDVKEIIRSMIDADPDKRPRKRSSRSCLMNSITRFIQSKHCQQ